MGISVVVRVGDSITNDITVTYGLRQGCTLVPTLFNLYFSADRRARYPQAGVSVRYMQGGGETGRRQNCKIKTSSCEDHRESSLLMMQLCMLCSHVCSFMNENMHATCQRCM